MRFHAARKGATFDEVGYRHHVRYIPHSALAAPEL
jgi:hypothetical protein